MAPIRRYLRISPYSVLEVRIYLDNPALATSWLLNPRFNILPKIITSIRPLVLPKLREEAERKAKKGKKKGVRDVVVEDEFEVSVFLTETSTRHAIMRKIKHFEEKKGKVGKEVDINAVTGNTAETAVDVEGVNLLREESDEMEGLKLDDIPAIREESDDEDGFEPPPSNPRRSKRTRATSEDEANSLFIPQEPSPKRARSTIISDDEGDPALAAEEPGDDKKKLGMKTTYDGYAIYGRVLCLIVKRRGTGHLSASGAKVTGGQANMENWIASTQAPVEEDG